MINAIKNETLQEEVKQLRRSLLLAEQRCQTMKNSIAFRLGACLIAGFTTKKGFICFPKTILIIIREGLGILLRRASLSSQNDTSFNPQDILSEALDIFKTSALPEAISWIKTRESNPQKFSNMLCTLAKYFSATDPTKAIAIAEEILNITPSPEKSKWFAFFVYDLGHLKKPAEILQDKKVNSILESGIETFKYEQIREMTEVLLNSLTIPPKINHQGPYSKNVIYIAHSSLPHHLSGYATRTHGILTSLQNNKEWNVFARTRPAYPFDKKDAREVVPNCFESTVDGVLYKRLQGPSSMVMPIKTYIEQASKIIEKEIQEHHISIVHAASNYLNALPALYAARRTGRPFIYEVRGLWEITSSSRMEAWGKTDKCKLMMDLEKLTANEADIVFTLTEGLKTELIQRGVTPSKISLLPNCVDENRLSPRPRDKALSEKYQIPAYTPVIGFIGSIVDYEGLDDLLLASSHLLNNGLDFRALLVGDGAELPILKNMVHSLKIANKVIITGRIPHKEVEKHYSLIDIAPFPRKPLPVCEMVSPLKPFEAMAMEKAVVVSSVNALKEIVVDGKTGMYFEKGNAKSLSGTLAKLISDPTLRQKLGEDARKFVITQRSWTHSAGIITNHYAQLISQSTFH